jgi:hypothetical protein
MGYVQPTYNAPTYGTPTISGTGVPTGNVAPTEQTYANWNQWNQSMPWNQNSGTGWGGYSSNDLAGMYGMTGEEWNQYMGDAQTAQTGDTGGGGYDESMGYGTD